MSAAGGDDGDETLTLLLADIAAAFAGTDRLATVDLLATLHAREDRPWGEWFGRLLTAHGLARLLAPLGITPKTIRTATGTAKGYLSGQFTDALARYTPPRSVTPSQPASGLDDLGISKRNTDLAVTDHKPGIVAESGRCDGVTDVQADPGLEALRETLNILDPTGWDAEDEAGRRLLDRLTDPL